MNTSQWTKSSTCDTGACVEVFATEPAIGMVHLNKISFTYDEWREFVRGVKAGEFDVS